MVRFSRVDALVACALVLLVVAVVPRCGGGQARRALLASPTLTPGVLNPEVTPATIGSTICVRGWTKTIRPPSSFTSALKLRQMREYGVGGSPSAYQEDHLISLGLGGHPTDPRNLWPEPRPRAEDVDQIEVELHDRICAGEISLAEAQRRITEIKHREG
jgi:hypothetical protein